MESNPLSGSADARWHIALWCWLLFTPTGAVAGAQSWTTLPEFAIGGAPGSETALWFVTDVSVGADGLVYVAEAMSARRVTVWRPPGTLTLELGPSSVAAEFGSPIRVRPDSTGFWVTYRGHFVRYGEDGRLLETIGRPPAEGRGFSGMTMVEDGLFLAMGARPTNVGRTGQEAVWNWPLFRIRQRNDQWIRDTIAILDTENSILAVRRDDGTGPVPSGFYTGQPFADHDFPYFAADGGRVGIVVRNGAPGEVRLTEISASADTVWSNRVSFPPQRVAPQQLQTTLESITRRALGGWDPARHVSEETVRQRATAALYAPDYLPPVTAAAATGSGELWLRSSEASDTLVAWYALVRGRANSTPRRILLPTWFRVRDATTTHVWGTRMDSRGAAQVLGRRLVPPAGAPDPS